MYFKHEDNSSNNEVGLPINSDSSEWLPQNPIKKSNNFLAHDMKQKLWEH